MCGFLGHFSIPTITQISETIPIKIDDNTAESVIIKIIIGLNSPVVLVRSVGPVKDITEVNVVAGAKVGLFIIYPIPIAQLKPCKHNYDTAVTSHACVAAVSGSAGSHTSCVPAGHDKP